MLQKIIETEINFCALFSNEVKTDFGTLFYNAANPLSWDSNHAVITRANGDYEAVVDQIEHFYLEHHMIPRIYYSFHPEESRILTLLKKRNWAIDSFDYRFYIHSKSKAPTVVDATPFFEFEFYTDDIKDVYLSDPNEGMWIVNVLEIGIERKTMKVIGLTAQGEVIGHYALHNRNSVTRVDSVIIHQDYRGKGFGKQLTQHMIHFHYSNYPNDLLYLCAFNPLAISIYERYGFEQTTMPGLTWNAYKT